MPELGGDTPIEQCLEEAASAGFAGIELGGKFPRNPGITNFLLDKYNLKMPGGWYGSLLRGRSVEIEWAAMQDHLNLLKLIKADVFVFADVSGSIQGDQSRKLSTRPNMDDEEFVQYCKKINEISNRLDVDMFMENTNDNTFLLYDTGHLLFAKANYERVLKKYISKINHIHCKDIRKNILENSLENDLSFRESFLDGVFTVPGDGCIDYKPLFKILYENSYEKWLIIEAEQDPIKANPLEYAKIGYNYLTNTLKGIKYEY